MQTLVLIRHAIAEDREEWAGDDHARPLTADGRKQAKRIANAVMELVNEVRNTGTTDDDERDENDPASLSLRSSPSLRCLQTAGPIAERVNVKIEIDDGLLEGRRIKPPPPREGGIHILSAHGDNIPWLLEKLNIDWDGQCKKGSIWFVQRDANGKVITARYYKIEVD